MHRFIYSCIISLSCSSVWAQLNKSDTLRFGYKVNVNGSWISGNVERFLINNNLDVSHVGKHLGLKTSNTYTYGTIFKRETENDFFSRNFLYVNPQNRFYPYAMLWLQNSLRQRIALRYQAGIGVSYGILRKAKHQVKLSTTVSREQTRYDGTFFFEAPKKLNEDTIDNWRTTLRVVGEHKVLNQRLRIHYESWYQPAFGDVNNWRYFLNASVELPVSKHISFRSALLYTHDNIVLSNIKRDDKILTFGLSISNY